MNKTATRTPRRKLPLEEGAGSVNLPKYLYGSIDDETFEYLLQLKWYTDKDGNPIAYLDMPGGKLYTLATGKDGNPAMTYADMPGGQWGTLVGELLIALSNKQAWDGNSERVSVHMHVDKPPYYFALLTKAEFEQYVRRQKAA